MHLSPKDLKNAYKIIENACQQAGISILDACNAAGVNRSIPERWKTENPKTLNIFAKLIEAIAKEGAKREKQAQKKKA